MMKQTIIDSVFKLNVNVFNGLFSISFFFNDSKVFIFRTKRRVSAVLETSFNSVEFNLKLKQLIYQSIKLFQTNQTSIYLILLTKLFINSTLFSDPDIPSNSNISYGIKLTTGLNYISWNIVINIILEQHFLIKHSHRHLLGNNKSFLLSDSQILFWVIEIAVKIINNILF